MKKNGRKYGLAHKGLALLLIAVMTLGILPVGTLATEDTDAREVVQQVNLTAQSDETAGATEETEANEATDAAPTAYEQIMSDLTVLEEEAKTLEADVEILNEFTGRLREVWNEAYDLNEVGEISDEELEAIDAKSNEILAYLKNTYGYENGVIEELDYELGGRLTTSNKAGLNIHLFDYGSKVNGGNIMSSEDTPVFTMNGGAGERYLDQNIKIASDPLDYIYTLPNLDEKGYPVISVTEEVDNIGNYQWAKLDYLFDKSLPYITAAPYDASFLNSDNNYDGTYTNYDVHHYEVADGSLFLESADGYYYYDSRNNHAYYDFDEKEMVVMDYAVMPGTDGLEKRYTGIGHFLPFNGDLSDTERYTPGVDYVQTVSDGTPIGGSGYLEPNIEGSFHRTTNDLYELRTYGSDDTNDSAELAKRINMWFGMTVDFDFYQPAGGKTDSGSMIYEFSGDDFMWVYIDNVLILDIFFNDTKATGMTAAGINFETGEVIVAKTDVDISTLWSMSKEERADYVVVDTTLKKCFEDAKADTSNFTGDTFTDYTKHSFDMFYMEYGTNTSNCYTRFNMEPLPENSVTVAKDVKNDPNPNSSFQFQIELADDQDSPLEKVEYTDQDGNTGTLTLNDGIGTFSLADDESYTFKLATNYTYEVTELDANKNNYVTTVSGETSGKLNDSTSGYIAYTNELQPADVITNKTVAEGEELGDYILTLDAYATGQTTSVSVIKPADIVMVVDQSGSMLRPQDESKKLTKEYMMTDDAKQHGSHGLYYLAFGNSTVNFLLYNETEDIWYRYETHLQKSGNASSTQTGAWDNYVPDMADILADTNDLVALPDDADLWSTFERNGIWQTRYGAAYDAMMEFVADLNGKGVDHNIAIVGFGGENQAGSALYDGSSSTQYKSLNQTHYEAAFKSVTTEYDQILASINALHTNQKSTHANVGLDIAKNVYEYNPISPEGSRDRITILFTDGATDNKTTALGHADDIKSKYGATVYSVGTANADVDFMDRASSNYADGSNGEKTATKYYFAASGAGDLKEAFGTIMQEISGTGVVLDENSILRDTISGYFKLPDHVTQENVKDYIKVYTADYQVGGTFSTWTDITSDEKIKITLSEKDGLDVVDVSGFDYSENYVAIANGQARGKKLIVQIPITIADSNIGGNHQKTNIDEDSGIYDDDKKVEDFPLPHVDTPAKVYVQKIVKGNMGDRSKLFSFTSIGQKYDNQEGKYYESKADSQVGNSNYLYAGVTANYQTEGTAETFTLTHCSTDDDRHEIKNLYAGSYIEISENDIPDGYGVEITYTGNSEEPTSNENGKIRIKVEPGMTITFTNTKNVTIDTGIVLDSLPYILILVGVIGVGAFLFLRKRRSYED